MSKLSSLIRRAPKRFGAVLAMVAAAIIVPAAVFAWGPSRATFTMAHPASYVTFNSITDNPTQGDERNFVQVRDANAGNETYADSISLQANHEYVIYMFYHNDASSTLNDAAHNYAGIAHGAYVKAEIPGTVPKGSTGTEAEGFVGATNANPGQVWDEVSFSNATGADMGLTYIPGSATIHNFGTINGQTLSDSIVTSGAPIGYNALDGNVPGCNDYSGFVTFRVKATSSDFSVQKQVRLAGQTDYQENVTATPGATLEYRIEYDNTGSTSENNVVLTDTLPANVSYVPGSTTIKNAANPNGKAINDDLTTKGINIGNYTAGSNAYVKFQAKVASVDVLPCGTTTLTNKATIQVGTETKSDTATATVDKTCTPEQITVCDLSTKKVVTINKSDFDSTKYSTDLTKCQTPNTLQVCDLSTKQVVTINESDFDSSKYSKDTSVCVPTPPELPHTGPTETILGVLGLGATVASLGYYIASRKALGKVNQ